jgi:hypothetical protein
MKVYMLWYQANKNSHPKVVSALRDYSKAEDVAQQLEFELRIIRRVGSPYEIGITRTDMNKIHHDPREKDDSTWVVFKSNTWFLDEDA